MEVLEAHATLRLEEEGVRVFEEWFLKEVTSNLAIWQRSGGKCAPGRWKPMCKTLKQQWSVGEANRDPEIEGTWTLSFKKRETTERF